MRYYFALVFSVLNCCQSFRQSKTLGSNIQCLGVKVARFADKNDTQSMRVLSAKGFLLFQRAAEDQFNPVPLCSRAAIQSDFARVFFAEQRVVVV